MKVVCIAQGGWSYDFCGMEIDTPICPAYGELCTVTAVNVSKKDGLTYYELAEYPENGGDCLDDGTEDIDGWESSMFIPVHTKEERIEEKELIDML